MSKQNIRGLSKQKAVEMRERYGYDLNLTALCRTIEGLGQHFYSVEMKNLVGVFSKNELLQFVDALEPVNWQVSLFNTRERAINYLQLILGQTEIYDAMMQKFESLTDLQLLVFVSYCFQYWEQRKVIQKYDFVKRLIPKNER